MPASSTTSSTRTNNRSLASAPKPHDKLWYRDGNIILVTDTGSTLFRVHKSVLAENSSVLREMFEVATPDDEETESQEDGTSTGVSQPDTWEGLPIVKLLQDTDEDVEFLLRSIYSRSFYRVYKKSTVEIVTSLLRMSCKYELPDLRRDVVQHLLRYFPTSLEGYKVRDKNQIFTSFNNTDLYRLLALAYRFDVAIVLPTLFYLCSLVERRRSYRYTYSDRNEFAVHLPQDVYQIVKQGWRKLKDGIEDEIKDPHDPQGPCSSKSCKARKDTHRGRRYVQHCYDLARALTPLEKDEGPEEEPKGFCANCRHRGWSKTAVIPGRLWERLPSFFGLPDWKALKKRNALFTSRD